MMLGNTGAFFAARKRLPYDAEVEYVYIGNRGFFTTPIKHSSNVTLSVQFKGTSQLTAVVGNYGSGVGIFVAAAWTARYGSQTVNTGVSSGGQRHSAELRNGIFTLDGTEYAFSPTTFSSDSFITIGQSPDNQTLHARTTIYGVQISDGNVAMNAIPVRVGQDGYFYDTVSRALLKRSDVGTFTPGPDAAHGATASNGGGV